jgi:hypothetical protein
VLTPLSLVSTPRKDLFFPPALHCFKVCIDSPRGFCLGTSGLYISCFNQIIPLPHYLLFLYHHALLIFNSSHYCTLCDIHV